ncbi:response regulator [bacterium]|nr:response regulator [bacterium]
MSVRELNCIMVLEDDENLRETLVDVLDSLDFIVEGAADAAEAVVRSEHRNFDIVISDVRMAGTMDGLGALALLKLRRPELKCIVMTGYADDDAPLRALDMHVDDYLYKPFEIKDVLRSIEQIRQAGKRRSFFSNLWDKHMRRPRLERALESLTDARIQALNGFRVAIRSKQINLDRSWELWHQWEQIELDFARIDMGEVEAPPQVVEAGVQRYRQFAKGFTQRTLTSSAPPSDPQFKAQFRKLYHKVLEGQVDVEELLMAVFVRRMPEGRRKLDGDLQKLYEDLWSVTD